jgi:AraC family transcriptional regulator
MRITAVPLHNSDLVRRGSANGFTLTEAWSPWREIPTHAHAALSITVLLEGAFEERYQPIHAAQSCLTGSLLLRPAGEIHANEVGRGGARTLSLELEPERLRLHGKALAPLLSLAHRRSEGFLDIALAMSGELQQMDSATALALESLSLELLARLLRVNEANETGPAPGWLQRTRDSMHDRFCEGSLRVSDLASEAGVHPVYFARVFRRFYRVSPGEYVRRLRIEWARQRVAGTSEPLAAIALECGFADQSHLARAFRRRYGVAPGRMRRNSSRRCG